jgi:hypothetical protein
MGALAGETRGALAEHFSNTALFPGWKLLVSELNWDVTLVPLAVTKPR